MKTNEQVVEPTICELFQEQKQYKITLPHETIREISAMKVLITMKLV